MGKVKKIFASALFMGAILAASTALADKAFLSDLILTNSKDHLLVYFTVEECFTPEIEKAIENGIETTFTFYIKLYEIRDYRLNLNLADIAVKHTIKFDTVKNIYEIKLPEQNEQAVIVKSFQEAKKLMAEIVALHIAPLSDLKKGHRYDVRMMAELDKIRLPYYLHNILFFLSLWNFETGWYSIDFRY